MKDNNLIKTAIIIVAAIIIVGVLCIYSLIKYNESLYEKNNHFTNEIN